MDEESSVSMSNEDDCIEENFSDDSNDMADNADEDNTSECLPLFQDSSLFVQEFNAVLLALKQRHNLSNLAFDSILKNASYLFTGREQATSVRLPV